MKIEKARARWILDSRGNPTVEVELHSKHIRVLGRSPSGASTGSHEALEIRDNTHEFHGKHVRKVLELFEKEVKSYLINNDLHPKEIDQFLKEKGGEQKRMLGTNLTTAVSIASWRLYARLNGMEEFEVISEEFQEKIGMPTPMANVINGGKHAGNNLSIQEFLIVPVGIKDIWSKVRSVSEIYHTLKKSLKEKFGNNAINVGDEGGFAPPLKDSREALEILSNAIEESGYSDSVKISLDAAASEFFSSQKYHIDGKELSRDELLQYYVEIVKDFDILTVEDPFHEEDFEGFAELRKKNIKTVGDDLIVTNVERIRKALKMGSISYSLLKINQIGTLSELAEAHKLSKKNGVGSIVSHRSGETECDFISDIGVGLGTEFIKIGAPARGERTVKYNRLLRIGELL